MKSLKGLKKVNKKIILSTSFFISFFIFIFILAKVSLTADEPVDAQTWILEKDVIHEISVTKAYTVSNDAGGLQGNVVTHKHIVFASLWIDDTTGDSHIYFINKSTGTIDNSLTINVPHSTANSSDSIYGHMNDMAYNPNTGEIFIPFVDPSDNIPKAAIITYTDKNAGTINKNNIKIVTIPTPQNVTNVSGMAYNENYGYIFRLGKQIWITQRDGDGFSSNLTTFSIGSSEIEKKFFYMIGQGIYSYEDYIYVTLYESGLNNANYQKYYYDTTEKGSNITLVYKINSSKTGATFLKALYIPGGITNYSLDSNNRLSELETGSFDPQTGDIYFGYNITRVSGETNKAKIFYKQNLGNQIVNGKSTYFYPSGLPKTQSSITGENMVVTDNLLRHYNANSNSRNNTKNLNITWKDLSNTNDALILGKQSSQQTFSNGSVSLDGTDDWVNMGNITGIYGKVTLETQFKLNSLPSYSSHIISNAEQGGYILYINPSGKPGFNAYIDGAYSELLLSESINLNQIYNLTGVFDGRYLKIYLDGVEKGSLDLGATKTIGPPASNTVMAIGANPVGSSANAGYTNATIYSARVYNSALTEDQIKQNILADRITPQNLSVNSKNLTLTINFSQAISSLSTGDISIQNGTISSITKISDYKYIVSISNVVSESTLSISTKSASIDIAGNNIVAGAAEIYIDVPKATVPTVTSYNQTYDAASHTVAVSGGSGGTIQYSIDNQTWSSTAPTYKDYTNGAKTIYVKVAGDSTHCDSDVITSSVTITKKEITVTANNKTISYGDSLPTLDWTIGTTGISGETGNASGTLKTSITNPSTPGTYDIINNTVALADNGNFKASNYSMTFVKGTLTINKYNLRNATVSAPYQVYDGSAKTPAPTVKMGSTTIDSSEYNVIYSNNINVGTASFTVSAKSSSTNFTGSKSGSFSIGRATVTIPSSPTVKTYNGSSQSSGIAAPANSSIVAVSSTTSATNAGTYSVVLKLDDTSSYQWNDGTITNKTVTWTINKYNLSNATISVANQTYDGKQKRPNIIAKIGTSFTIPTSEYVVSYGTNINAGTGTFTITAKSNSNNYSGSQNGTFTINKYNLTNANLVIANQIYDGNAKTPEPIVEMGNTTISSNEYDVTYSNNINAGTAYYTVTAKSSSTNFTGSKTATFTIVKASITVPSSPSAKTYNGSSQSSGITAPTNTSIVTGSSTTSATNAGTYNVILKLDDASNYQWNDGTTENKTVTWTINKYNLSNATVHAENQSYDGNAKTPSPTVKMGSTTISSSEYDVTYSNNINEGTASFTVTAKSSSTNFTGSKTGSFTIGKSTVTIPSSPTAKTYNGSIQSSGITLPANTSIVTGSSTTSATNSGTYNVVLQLDDVSIYQWSDGTTENKTVKWTINKYDLNNATIASISAQNYSENAITPIPTVTVPIPSGSTTTLTNNTHFTYSYTNNINPTNSAKVTITAKDNSNYTGSKDALFTINPRVIFNSNGGAGIMNNQFVSYNANTELNQTAFTRTGYIFGGWATSQANADAGTVRYEDKEIVKLTLNITLYAIWIPNNYEITNYTVEDNYISNVPINTTITEFKEHIIVNSTGGFKIYDKEGTELTSEDSFISTGMSIKVFLEEKTISLLIIVTGDIDGNGIINISDLISINKHRLDKYTLSDAYFKAADINKDKNVDIKDLLLLNKIRLGKITSY